MKTVRDSPKTGRPEIFENDQRDNILQVQENPHTETEQIASNWTFLSVIFTKNIYHTSEAK